MVSLMVNDYQACVVVVIVRQENRGWTLTHIIQAPMSSERFNAGVVSAMQIKK
jgi:hypothetical protein